MENILLGLTVLIIILLTACGLLWYRGFLYRKKLRYWRNEALKLNANKKYSIRNNTVGAPWLRK